MEKHHQIGLVQEILTSSLNDITKKIHDGKIPEEWNGIELRQYCADYMHDHIIRKMDKGRMKEYRNTILVNNL